MADPGVGEGESPSLKVAEPPLKPSWQESARRFLMHGVTFASTCVTAFLLLRASRHVLPSGSWHVGLALTALVGVIFLVIAIHELGHFLSARHSGQTVLRAQVGPFDFIAGRKRWRVRWRRATIRVDGYVMACADFSRPLRPQMLWMVAGGIAANLIAAVGFLNLAAVLPAPWSLVALAIAVYNTGIGLANAIPTQIALPSDGMNLLAWWRGIPDDHPDLLTSRITSASIAGHTADEVSEADLARLDAGPLPSQLLAHWIRFKAGQMRGEWAASADAARALDAFCETAPPEHAQHFADIRWMARVDGAFSQALADGRPDALRTLSFDKHAHWLSPFRWPRSQALLATFEGNISLRDRLLAESAWWAEDSVDGAVGVSEAFLRNLQLTVQE